MDQQRLTPNQELGQFDGPDGERFAFIVSRTGRSVAVRPVGTGSTAGRIWHPLDDDRRIEVEDRWRARGAAWIESFRTATLHAWARAAPRLTPGQGPATLAPSRLLGSFMGPRGRNCFAMVVSTTGRTVTARLGGEHGQIVARASRPVSAEPSVVFQGLHRENPAEWKRTFADLFTAALRGAVQAGRNVTAAVGASV